VKRLRMNSSKELATVVISDAPWKSVPPRVGRLPTK